MKTHEQKEIIVFDLDETLTESKSDIDNEMSNLLGELLKIKKVAVISGGAYPQMEKALLSKLNCDASLFSNLFLFPTNGAAFYKYVDGKWRSVYREEISQDQRKIIITALKNSLAEAGYQKPKIVYGEIIEDRGTQVTFSGLGQQAPLAEKLKWDPRRVLREKIIKAFENHVSNFDAKIGGSTSIDINRKEIDKAYGLKQIEKNLNIPIEKMLFIGNALFEGGNDYPIIGTGVDTIAVKNPEDTKKYIKEIISEL